MELVWTSSWTNWIYFYPFQLNQVEQAIQAAGPNPDLDALRSDLQDIIKLTDGMLNLHVFTSNSYIPIQF